MEGENAGRIILGMLEPSPLGPKNEVGTVSTPIFVGQQSDLNGSAAALCLLMALVALGEVARDDVSRIAALRPDKKYRPVGPWLTRDYLVGADTGDLRHLVRLLTDRYRATFTYAKNGRAARWILNQLRLNRWVVIGLESGRETLEHWCLIVGYETPALLRRLFLLDPTLAIPVATCWNARYDVPQNNSGVFFEPSNNTMKARLRGALALFPVNANPCTCARQTEVAYV